MALSLPAPAVLGGATALLLLQAFDLTGPDRSPRALSLVFHAATLTALGTLALSAGRARFAAAPAWIALCALGLLALALGIAPELFRLPMQGVGERLWGLPVMLAAPLAGAAFWVATDRARALGGLACAVLLAALLGPVELLGDVRPALLHRFHFGTVAIIGVALVGCAAVVRPSLSALAGKLLVGTLPAWCLVRVALALEVGAEPAVWVAAFLLSAGATALFVHGALGMRDLPADQRRLPALTLESVAVLGLCLLWLALRAFTWRWSTTDENIYFYAANQLADGVLPYRDFFFSHPPMHIGVPAILFAIFGFSLPLAKAIPTVATLVTGLLVWRIGRDHVDRITGIVSLGCFLFAFELLQASVNMNGVNLTSLWLTAGFYAFLRGRHATAGALLGIAITTGFYAIAAALGILVLALVRDLRTGLRLLAAFAAVGGGINLLCIMVAGDAYLDAVYRYHLLKDDKSHTPELIRMLYHHTHLVAGVLLAPGVAAWLRYRRAPHCLRSDPPPDDTWFFSPKALFQPGGVGTVGMAWLLFVALLVEFTRFQELYSFYFALLAPTAALCTGYVIAGLLAAAWHELREAAAGRVFVPGIAAALGLAIAFAGWVPLAAEAQWIFSRGGGKGVNGEFLQAGTQRSYQWIEPAALPSVTGPVVRALFWRDHRVRWQRNPGVSHFLWQKSLHLSVADEIGRFVAETTEPDETVAGSSLAAPIVALASGRRIADQQVDTNRKRFQTGLYTLPQFFDDICNDKLRYVVTSPSGFVNDRMMNQLPIAQQQFVPMKRFLDPWAKFQRPGRNWGLTLWEVKDKSADGPRCHWVGPRTPPKRAK